MKAGSEHIYARRMGAWVGRVWRAYLRGERRVVELLTAAGAPLWSANAFALIARLAIVAAIAAAVVYFIVPFLILLIVCCVIGSSKGIDISGDHSPKWLEKDPDDHRDELFYHPLNYNDDPDPRFDDPRHRGE